MMTLTRHVMDAVLPHVPTRQWVLTLPHALRYRVAYDQPLSFTRARPRFPRARPGALLGRGRARTG